MPKDTGYVLQGDRAANTLVAQVVLVDGKAEYYNIAHGAGGKDVVEGSIALSLKHVGVELYGEEGNDAIVALNAPSHQIVDTLSGGDGNDVIYTGDATDIIDGGDGLDTLRFSGGKWELGASNISNIEILYASRIIGDGADLDSFEQIYVSELSYSQSAQITGGSSLKGTKAPGGDISVEGSAFDDHLDVSASDGVSSINGGSGDDTIVAGIRASTLIGGLGNDTITGSSHGDTINGGGGDDVIDGGDGNDTITDKAGNDTVRGGEGNDVLIGGGGADAAVRLFDGGDGNDRFELSGTAEVTLIGGEGNDLLQFNGDADHLHVSGVETLLMPHNRDPLSASVEFLNSFMRIHTFFRPIPTNIRLSDGGLLQWHDPTSRSHGKIECNDAGNTIDLTTAREYWTVLGGNHADTIILGRDGTVRAGGGDDQILGGSGSDIIRGNDGNDTIDGRGGGDILQGDAGRDTFVFEAGSGIDTISSFDATSKSHDIIDLSAVGGIADYHDFIKNQVLSDAHGVTILLDDQDKIHLVGLELSQLHKSLFVF